MMVLKWSAYLLIAFVLFHWLTAGYDNIIEGPPEIPDVTLVPPSPSPGPSPEPVQNQQ